MQNIVSTRSIYFYDEKRNRIDIKRGDSTLDDAYLEHPTVKGFIDQGIVRIKGEAEEVVDELAQAKEEATFWKACYEEVAAKLPPDQAEAGKSKGKKDKAAE